MTAIVPHADCPTYTGQLSDCDRAPCRLSHLDCLGNLLRGHLWGLDLSGESKRGSVLRQVRLSRILGLALSVGPRVPRVGYVQTTTDF